MRHNLSIDEKQKYDLFFLCSFFFLALAYLEEHSVGGSSEHFVEAFDLTAVDSNSVK